MGMTEMSELKKLLLNVPDSYSDFVESLLDEARKSEKRKQGLIKYLKDNPEATTSEVLSYLVGDLGLYEDYRLKRWGGFIPTESPAGSLHKYADASKIPLEKDAFANAMVMKHS
jgi:hypothetical protein